MEMNVELAQRLIKPTTTLVWLRRDLRLEDHAALYHALMKNKNVLPVFIFDTEILDRLEDKEDRRVDFIHQTVAQLHTQLARYGSSLLVLKGNPVELFKRFIPHAVFTNHDYEPYAQQRDENVRSILKKKGVAFYSFKDQVIFEKDEIVKSDGNPYTVFTPYSKKWKEKLKSFFYKGYRTEKYFSNLIQIDPIPVPSLNDIGFTKTGAEFPPQKIRTNIIQKYGERRDFPGIDSTSRLSVHLRFGTVSIRRLVEVAIENNETWLNELIWREFYHMILWHFPHVVKKAFKPSYDRIEWRNNQAEFEAWCDGQTGYPIVDAGMRELNATGFMHNRVRMIVASFLTKHLLIDWRWGEAHFAEKLLDFDLAANNGGWQWSAGSGCDAAPYFRVFNPYIQTKKFDPDMTYIRKWVPEFQSASYPSPIVDHDFARKRVLKTYKIALTGDPSLT